MNARFRADATADAMALLVATLDRDHIGWAFLVDSLETREDALRAVAGLASLAATLCEHSFHEPREFVAQWAQICAAEGYPEPPRNADQRRRDRGRP